MLPTDDSRRYFFLSGFLSLGMLLLLSAVFVYVMFRVDRTKTFGLEKKTYISISLKNINTDSLQKKRRDHMRQSKRQSESKKLQKRKRSAVDAVKEDVDVDSLFDNVWTKKVDTRIKKRKKSDAKLIRELEKAIAIPSEKNTTKTRKALQNRSDEQEKLSSSAEEVNRYLAKIHAIVYSYFFPPANTQGYVVRAVLELSPLGKVLDFRVLDYSASEALNAEADMLAKRIRNIVFPKNPQNKTQRVLILLKPEDKE